MASAVLFPLVVIATGFAILRTLGLAKGAPAIGLTPAIGLAGLGVLTSALSIMRAPPPTAGVAALTLGALGLLFAARDAGSLGVAIGVMARTQRVAIATLCTALVVSIVVVVVAFWGAVVPLSPHDGAAHTEAVQAYRLGQTWSDWYPPGMAAMFAAFLQVLPWVDSAEGSFAMGATLPMLAALAVFGLGMSVWRDMRVAAAGALLLGFTYLFPYFPQIWSGWPLSMSLILVMGVWSVALEYLARPLIAWGVLAGLSLGAIVLVHGSELLTVLFVLPLLLLSTGLRGVEWRRLIVALVTSIVVAIICALAYLPSLIHWASSGGAYAAALADTPPPPAAAGVTVSSGPSLFITFALSSLGVDAPLRLVLMATGIVCAFRARAGRAVVAIGAVFAGLATVMTLLNEMPLVRQLYALTFPWGMHYRLLMIAAITGLLVAGAGGTVLVERVFAFAQGSGAWHRRLRRLTGLLVVTWIMLATWATVFYVAYPASEVLGYDTNDDGAAMAWLRSHASSNEVVVNDGYADAGIWAPYKASVAVLLPRWMLFPTSEIAKRQLVISNIGQLDRVPEAMTAACDEHVRWVYYGARTSAWDSRRFPPLSELRASSALEEAFSHGAAVVFRVRLNCA